jgi:hypothetical protein
MSPRRKATFDSVTTKPCRCTYLAQQAENPDVPIVFDRGMNEYNIVGPSGTQSVIYHCPWCGGAAPRSKRPTLFAAVTQKGLQRLEELTRGLSSLEDAVARFGPPDEEQRAGTTITTPASAAQPPMTTVHRTLKFGKLSATVDVVIEDHGLHGVRAAYVPKYIGSSEGGEV